MFIVCVSHYIPNNANKIRTCLHCFIVHSKLQCFCIAFDTQIYYLKMGKYNLESLNDTLKMHWGLMKSEHKNVRRGRIDWIWLREMSINIGWNTRIRMKKNALLLPLSNYVTLIKRISLICLFWVCEINQKLNIEIFLQFYKHWVLYF